MGFGTGGGLGFGSGNPPQLARSNGLLNALSGGSRVAPGNRVASPSSISGESIASGDWVISYCTHRLILLKFVQVHPQTDLQ